jgi:hypothetical protein
MQYLTDNSVLSAKVNDAGQTAADIINSALERKRRETAALVENIKSVADAVARLRAAGFETNMNEWCDGYLAITVEVADLPRVHQALGRLKKAYHDLDDPKKKTIRVTLKPEKYDTVYVHYVRKLPRGEKVKCRIVRRRVTEAKLVCEL